MANPTASDLHVNTALTEYAIQYTQDKEGFIADKACPTVGVDKRTDIYPVWSKADFFRMQARQLGDKDPTPFGGFGVDMSNTYNCERYGLAKLLLATEKANSDVNLEMATTAWLTEQILIAREYVVVNKLLAANWTTSYQGVNAGPNGAQFLQWDDAVSNPFVDIRTINSALKTQCGRRANTLLVTSDVDDVLKEHSDILEKVKYTQTGIVTNDLLAAAFGVKNYLVADAVYNTAAEGLTASMAQMATKKGLLYYVPETASKDVPSACYNFSWSQFDQVPNGQGAAVRSWDNENPVGQNIASEMYFEPKITAPDAGIYLYDVIP
jgi:hypothetical protein